MSNFNIASEKYPSHLLWSGHIVSDAGGNEMPATPGNGLGECESCEDAAICAMRNNYLHQLAQVLYCPDELEEKKSHSISHPLSGLMRSSYYQSCNPNHGEDEMVLEYAVSQIDDLAALGSANRPDGVLNKGEGLLVVKGDMRKETE